MRQLTEYCQQMNDKLIIVNSSTYGLVRLPVLAPRVSHRQVDNGEQAASHQFHNSEAGTADSRRELT
jgi:hypothetical protein